MNNLAIDYGTKNVGIAYSINDIIFTEAIINNDLNLIQNISNLVKSHNIGKIYVGISEGKMAKLTMKFVDEMSAVIKLPIETVEESVSTIEATKIIKNSKNSLKKIDSVSAAVILQRVIS